MMATMTNVLSTAKLLTSGNRPSANTLNNRMPHTDKNSAMLTDKVIKISDCKKILLNNVLRLAPNTACKARVLC